MRVDAGAADLRASVPTGPRGGPRLIFPRLGAFYAAAEPLGYAALRVLVGATILTHGVPKLFRLSHGAAAPDAFAGLVRTLGERLALPGASAFAVVVTALETFGAIALACGFATRLVAPALAIEMVVIAFGVHWPQWAWGQHGMEYPIILAGILGAISVRGGGRYSLDHALGREI